MRSVINKPHAPLYRLFLDLEPVEFTRQFNALLPAQAPKYAPPAGRAQVRTWQDQQAAVGAVLKRWDTRDLYAGQQSREMVRLVNEGLATYATMRVTPDLRHFIPFARDTRAFGMLGMVWIHMARLLTGQAAERACAQCGASFIPRRADAEFCKPYCRLKHHRQASRAKSIPAFIPARSTGSQRRKKKAVRISPNRP